MDDLVIPDEDNKVNSHASDSVNQEFGFPISIPQNRYNPHLSFFQNNEIEAAPYESARDMSKALRSAQILKTNKCQCMERSQILIVDDNSFNIMAVELVLEEFGLGQPDIAMNGQQALEKVQDRLVHVLESPCTCGKGLHRNMYQLILMDCNMPVMDGFEATTAILQEVKAHGMENQDPYIVALTAYNTTSFEGKCDSVGMKKFLTKPLDSNKLKVIL